MTNSKAKGKRGERIFVNLLKDIFPDIHRNWHQQTFSKHNGCDLEADNCCFNFEVKIGKLPKKNQQFLDQVKEEGKKENYDVVLCKRDNCDPYVMMPFDDFKQLLKIMKKEGVI